MEEFDSLQSFDNEEELESTDEEEFEDAQGVDDGLPEEPEEQADAENDGTEAPSEPAPAVQVEGTSYSDPFFNIPPVLGAMNSLDRESFWQEVAAAKPRRKKPSAAAIILAMLMVVIMTVVFITVLNGRGWLIRLINGGKEIEFTLPTAEKPQLDSTLYQEDGRYTIEGVAKAVSPSVVALEIYDSKSALLPTSQGSGIIMSEDGYIVTNAHVVDKAARVKAILDTGAEFAAEIIGSDEATDIAVIKIGTKGLQPAEYGDSSAVTVGEDVVCIGSPAGFYGSVTKGIVSGVERLIKVESFSMPMRCIQVDAAINPGNSGGALVNMWGQVIGITSSKLTSARYDGIGFAISINAARPVIEELVSIGNIQNRPKIGISFFVISEESAVMSQSKAGLYIADIDENCNIYNTELKIGDIITSLNGTPVSDTETVKNILDGLSPGDTMTAHVYRPDESGTGGTEFDISFKLNRDEGSFIEK